MILSIEEPAAKARPDEQVWPFTGGGEMRLWMVSPHILVVTMIGHGDAGVMPAFEKAVGPPPSDGKKQYMFAELWQLDSYEPGLRKGMTEWVNRRRAHMAKVHCLFRSKVVAMGVSVAALAIGGGIVTSHSSRAAFNAAFADAQRA